MPTQQGDVRLLQEPISQQLLQSKSPAHLAYNWRDGTPRVIPIGFHWNGQEIVLATATDAPKTKVLTNGLVFNDQQDTPLLALSASPLESHQEQPKGQLSDRLQT